ncbi:DUF2986 domain-containing protein [uncultured Shewanella sp.]|uniref:DUF2986 domain-containing protein n=1 Tax=uncultured Shewanella sp. TaxID=173975 RepID=UPI0026196ADF|nr:DUF2986 domain-containing protein [uncultured Shewanella sp.]
MNRTKKITQKFMSKTRKANAKLSGRKKPTYIAKADRVATEGGTDKVSADIDESLT